MPDNKIFRQAALERLASPEQLHTLMQVTDAKGWLSLLGCGLLLLTAIVWGVFGRVPTKVQASGILIHSGGLADVVALGDGLLSSLSVDVGDMVQKGQVVGEMAQPELAEQIKGLKAKLEEQKANLEHVKQAGGRDVGLRAEASHEARKNVESAAAAGDARNKELRERAEAQARLYEKGLITKEALESTREALRTSELSMQAMHADMQRLLVDDFSAARANEVAVAGEQMQVRETTRQIKLLEERFVQNSRVVSTHTGRILEIRATVGDMLSVGKPVVSLELTTKEASLEALLYVDSRQGKLLRPGMRIEIQPSVVKKERYGVLLGTVRSVESFPSTRSGMMRVLRNDQLVDSFLAETSGTPIGVRAELTRDASTPSGYSWSSKPGPDVTLTSGTRCGGAITTRTQRPVGLVFPALDLGS